MIYWFRHKTHAFTLSEVLVALALLGIVAAFTIPKILNNSSNAEKIAKAKETLSIIESSWYKAKLSPISTTSGLSDIIYPNLNCIRTYIPPDFGGSPVPLTCTLPNGVDICLNSNGINYTSSMWTTPQTGVSNTIIIIDLNGFNTPPNSYREDVYDAKFHPFGDFDVNQGTVYQPAGNNKNFFYGGVNLPNYGVNGAVVFPDNSFGKNLLMY